MLDRLERAALTEVDARAGMVQQVVDQLFS
jgi:hypothetical protein